MHEMYVPAEELEVLAAVLLITRYVGVDDVE